MGPFASALSKRFARCYGPSGPFFYAVGYTREQIGAAMQAAADSMGQHAVYVECDCSNWDATMGPEKMALPVVFLELAGAGKFRPPPQRRTYLELYLASINRAGRAVDGTAYTTSGTVGSGDYTTTCLNTAPNGFVGLWGFCRSTRLTPEYVVACTRRRKPIYLGIHGGDDTWIVHISLEHAHIRHFAPMPARFIQHDDGKWLDATLDPAGAKARQTAMGLASIETHRRYYAGLRAEPNDSTWSEAPKQQKTVAQERFDTTRHTIDWDAVYGCVGFVPKTFVARDIRFTRFYSSRPWRAIIDGESRIVLGGCPGRVLTRQGHSYNQQPDSKPWQAAAIMAGTRADNHVPLVGHVWRHLRAHVDSKPMATSQFDPEAKYKPATERVNEPDELYNAAMFLAVYGVPLDACLASIDWTGPPLDLSTAVIDVLLQYDL